MAVGLVHLTSFRFGRVYSNSLMANAQEKLLLRGLHMCAGKDVV